MTAAGQAPGKPQTFRSPFAVAIWWLWVLFAAGNLIDLAVQGRDQLSLVAALILLLVTGVVYTTAQRPRIVTDSGGLLISNPLREHRVVWAAVAGIDSAELVRVHCEWPAEGGTDAGTTASRAIYSWAVHSSRRRQVAAQLRAQRRARGRGARGTFGVFGAPPEEPPAPPAPIAADAEHVVSTLTALAEQARTAAPDQRAVPPASSWYWPAFAAIIVPALALLIATLA